MPAPAKGGGDALFLYERQCRVREVDVLHPTRLMKGLSAVLVLALGAALVASYWHNNAWRDWVGALVFDNSRRVSFARSGSDIPFSPIFSGIAAIDGNQLALADYGRLYCLRLDSGDLRVVEPRINATLPPVWVPTGLAFDAVRKHLFVANYFGNQVYEGSLDCTTAKFTILGAITSKDTISPENVALSEDGATMAVANYDGGNVVAFRRKSNGEWAELWSQPVPFAHAVAILNGAAYGSSLQHGTLERFDLETGRVLLRVGKKGWNPKRNEMLWPTALAVREGRLLLSDAHTGLVCQLEALELEAEWCFGGNGPSSTQLNMPYAVATVGTDIAITSTFQGRVLVIRREGGVANVLADYVPSGQAWADAESLMHNPQLPTGAWLPSYQRAWPSKTPYVSKCDLGEPVEGLHCGFGSLWKGGKRWIEFPRIGGVLNTCGLYYFVQSYRGERGTILFSPQNACLIYLSREEAGEVGVAVRRVKQGSWRVGDYLVSESEVLSLARIETELRTVLSTIGAARRGGVLLPADAAALFFPDVPDAKAQMEAFAKRLRAALISPEERHFAEIYLACTLENCAATTLRVLALSISSVNRAGTTLETRYLPCFLSGARCLA